jgi:hypothetical protein
VVPVVNATVHVLPGLDGAHPRSINEFEEVVGSTSANVPFYYSASRGIVLLDHTGFATAQAVSINDHGIMAGTAMSTPVVWLNLPGAQFRVLEKPASETCNVAGLNFDGAVIGTCLGGGASFGTLFAWHGLPTETSGYRYNAISDDRWLGGALASAAGSTAPFIMSPTGQLTILHGRDGGIHPGSAVTAVSVHGYLAGYSTEGGCTQAIAWGLWTPNHDTWPAHLLGTCGTANGITPDGYIVGTTSANWAFLWYENPGPGLQRLPGLGGTNETSTAVAISLHEALGTITSGGVTHTVIWDLPNR